MTDTCNCTMEASTVPNDTHDDNCHLWTNTMFRQYEDRWCGETQRLVMNTDDHRSPWYGPNMGASPWDRPEDWVWEGDDPVCRITTAQERLTVQDPSPQELEAIAAMEAGAKPDEYNWVKLDDGSFADLTDEVTYRITTDTEGDTVWEREEWYPEVIGPRTGSNAHKAALPVDDDYASWFGPRCEHRQSTVRMKGVTFHASGVHRHDQQGTFTPDFGLYADFAWMPDCVGTFIPWRDYGLPTINLHNAVEAIKHAYDLAEKGMRVEVGCIGGHGRTGTILACLAILADDSLDGPTAIKYVRAAHCKNAVESKSQEWFIRWFHAQVHGLPFSERRPDRPAPQAPAVQGPGPVKAEPEKATPKKSVNRRNRKRSRSRKPANRMKETT